MIHTRLTSALCLCTFGVLLTMGMTAVEGARPARRGQQRAGRHLRLVHLNAWVAGLGASLAAALTPGTTVPQRLEGLAGMVQQKGQSWLQRSQSHDIMPVNQSLDINTVAAIAPLQHATFPSQYASGVRIDREHVMKTPNPLAVYLRNVSMSVTELTLSCRQVERILNPLFCCNVELLRAWWANPIRPDRVREACEWAATGWEVTFIDRRHGWVTFRRC
jgi:hypothetical protein